MNLHFKRNWSAGTPAEKRSKCSLLARSALLSAILMLSAVFCQAQITINDSIATSANIKNLIGLSLNDSCWYESKSDSSFRCDRKKINIQKINRMSNEINNIINFRGNQISLFSDNRADYVSLTDIFKVYNRYSKSISAWLKTRQTLEFLNVWEKKHNPEYKETQLSHAIKLARERNGLSAQAWIDLTNAKGIFTRAGENAGTYAHKDIAIRFAGWLNPEIELFLVEEIQRLKELERKKNSFELLTHEQILKLVIFFRTIFGSFNQELYL